MRHPSIQTKLTWAIMLSAALLLMVVSGIVVVAEIYVSRSNLQQNVEMLADSLTARIYQPLLLGEEAGAEQTLSSLARQKNIRAAYLFNSEGLPFVEYLKEPDTKFVINCLKYDFQGWDRVPLAAHTSSSWTHFSLFKPVTFEGRTVGLLYLLSDLKPLYSRLNLVFFAVFVGLVVLSLFSWLLAGRLHQPISIPLRQLAELAAQIAVSRDYSLRARKVNNDEIGILVDSFNHMLVQIEKQRDSLAAHQQELEKTVAQRTAELQQTVVELNQARQQADQANAAKSDFLAKMTHELRTPLIGVLGMNEMLLRSELDERQRMLADTVQTSGEDLLRLISDILDISRIEAGRLELQKGPVNLVEIVEGAVALLAPQARNKQLTMVPQIPLSAAWKVDADAVRLRQIIINLLGNALKFTHAGSVRISLQKVSEEQGQGYFELTVADTGIGMDQATCQQIFEVFYQAEHSSHVRETGGAGLGLAIVHQLVELMGGRIEFSSRPGQGSTFKIFLELPLLEPVPLSMPDGLIGERVLLSCQNTLMQEELADRLQDIGLQVVQCSQAVDAFYQLRAAQRQGEPYLLAVIDAALELDFDEPLWRTLAADAELENLRMILVLSSQDTTQLGVGARQVSLPMPLSWQGLGEALARSWQGLRLLTVPAKVQQQPGHPARLCLLSEQIASRELLRMDIQQVFSEPLLSATLDEFETLVSGTQLRLLIVDTASLEEKQLQELLRKLPSQRPLLVFCGAVALSSEQRELADLIVEKPLSADALQAMAKLFAGSGHDTRESAGDTS